MRHADTPSGPGKPTRERRDAVTAQEEVDEMAQDAGTALDAEADARHADRNAHGNRDRDGSGDDAGGQT